MLPFVCIFFLFLSTKSCTLYCTDLSLPWINLFLFTVFDVIVNEVVFLFFYKFIYLFLAELGLQCGARASHCSGFSCCGAWTLGARASVVVAHGLSSCGSRALELRLSSCGSRAWLLCGMWDLPRPGLKPVSPVLAGGFLTTAPPGKARMR